MFSLVKNLNGQNFEITESLPTTASETYTEGEALTLASGALTKAGVDSDGTQMFIALESYAAPATGNRKLFVDRILPTKLYQVKSQADNSATAIGAQVTLHTDRLQVTATTTKGVFEVVDLLGDGEAGTEIIGRFPTAAGR